MNKITRKEAIKKMRKLLVLAIILVGLSSCVEQCEYELVVRNSQGQVVGYEYYWDDCY
jgi:hypothetical protein